MICDHTSARINGDFAETLQVRLLAKTRNFIAKTKGMLALGYQGRESTMECVVSYPVVLKSRVFREKFEPLTTESAVLIADFLNLLKMPSAAMGPMRRMPRLKWNASMFAHKSAPRSRKSIWKGWTDCVAG